MKLVFTYTWEEWVEANMRVQGLTPRGQKGVWTKLLLPLSLLFLFSAGCALSGYPYGGAGLMRALFFWTVAAAATLLGLTLAYFLLFESLTRWNSWAKYRRLKRSPFELEVEPEWILINSVTSGTKLWWRGISRYLETDNLFILYNGMSWVAVPKRLFRGGLRRSEFLRVIKCLAASNQP